MQTYKLRNVCICLDELVYRHTRIEFCLLGIEIEVPLYNRLQNAGQPSERGSVLLFPAYAVEAGKDPNGVHPFEPFIDAHRAQKRLIKPCLIYVCDDEDIFSFGAEFPAKILAKTNIYAAG